MDFCQSLQSLKTLYDGFVSAGNRTTITVNVHTAITAHIAGVTETSLCLSLTGRAVLNFDTISSNLVIVTTPFVLNFETWETRSTDRHCGGYRLNFQRLIRVALPTATKGARQIVFCLRTCLPLHTCEENTGRFNS